MKADMVNQIKEVEDYYRETLIDYKVLWMKKGELAAIHFGYYDLGLNQQEDHFHAVTKMNEVLCSLAEIKKTDKVLDAGCGFGASALWLAKNIGCHITGITVVPHQISEGNKYVKENHLDQLVNIEYGDYAGTKFENQSFDVVWCLESVVHAASKEAVIKEAARILKKGGRLIICEYLLDDDRAYSKQDKTLIQQWCDGWKMPSLLSAKEYQGMMKNAGFATTKVIDITDNVRPSLQRLGRFVKIAKIIIKVLPFLFSKTHAGNVSASDAQLKALDQKLWRYKVIVAEK